MKNSRSITLFWSQRGDTLVEVLASIAVIGVALAGGYALASHALRTGIDATQRSTALSLAQGQIEFLKNANINKTTDPATIASYTPTDGQSFCINDTTAAKTSGVGCDFGQYTIAITYNDATKIFTIEPSWDRSSSIGRDEMTLYYKLPNIFN